MFTLLAQLAPGKPAAQHLTPVANDIDWWVLALCITGSAAVLTFGLGRVVRFSLKGLKHEKLYELLARFTLVLICTGFGAIAGWRVWDAWLGGLAGAVGSGASPMIMHYIMKFVDRFVAVKTAEISKKEEKDTPE